MCVTVNTEFECSPGYVFALSAVLTQHTDFEIYEFAGLSGARAVCERSLCVHNLAQNLA